MITQLKVPEVGESVQEALLAQWVRRDGDTVRKDEVVFVIETDKVTLEISSPADGVLKILVPEGETVAVGTVVGTIQSVSAQAAAGEEPAEKRDDPGAEPAPPSPPKEPAEKQAPPPEPAAGPRQVISPSVRALVEERGAELSQISPTGPGGRVTEGDVLLSLERQGKTSEQPAKQAVPARRAPEERVEAATRESTYRKPMSRLRQRIAERLLDVRRNTAMLTTFNEADMSRIQALRKQFGEEFRHKHGVRLGMMSFFIRASVAALKEMPEVNAFIEGNEIVFHNYYHIGVAISAERGLIVPVIRNADNLGLAELERAIVDFVKKTAENRLDLSDLEGGTFTITNGGVFGSLLSTPILNPPQSAILGMHKIEDRPVVVDGQIVVRPMMYLALSYDHRIIDGREAVTFLRKIKEYVESPERFIMEL
ncbi:MAG: 2-oxoglutarate dehydrogenase complex dihydrolipoyllysine-residue succinyltransferase [Syntrophobacteraceae bacterium]